jgi:hypothetical protein
VCHAVVNRCNEEKLRLTPTSATISFTLDSMQGIFDELYEARFVEVVVATKRTGSAKPKPGEFFIQKKAPKTGEEKQIAGFACDVHRDRPKPLDSAPRQPDSWRLMSRLSFPRFENFGAEISAPNCQVGNRALGTIPEDA